MTALLLLRPTLRGARTLRTTAPRRHGSHGPTYDQPGGWYLNTPPGTKPVKEGWEGIMYYGFAGSLVAAGIAYAYKPDTSIQTWALEEARRRLEADGSIPDSTVRTSITDELKTVSGK